MVETFVQSTDDVVRFLKDQHNLIRDMFEEVFSASTTEARQTAITRTAPVAGRARDVRGDGGAPAWSGA